MQCILEIGGREYSARIIDRHAFVAVPGCPDYPFRYDSRTRMWEIFHPGFDTTGVRITGTGVDMREPAFPDGARVFASQLADRLNQLVTPDSTTVTVGEQKYHVTYGHKTATTTVGGQRYTFTWDSQLGWEVYRATFDTTGVHVTGMGVDVREPAFPDGIPHLAYAIAEEMNRKLDPEDVKSTAVQNPADGLVARIKRALQQA